MHRCDLLEQLARYETRHLDEAAFVERARQFVATHPDTFYRHHLPAHVSASTWVVNPSRYAVLLMHHRKLDRWLQPGGHADGDTDMRQVALKECAEETGVAPEHIRLVHEAIFDVDIHSTQEPFEGAIEHHHIDIRYLVEIDDSLPVPGNEESFELRWVPLSMVARLNNSRSTLRMVEKTRRMR
ncbi:MAG: NUDIX hydrolase [Halothiobacillaceae bacterium]|nr:NUDIX hydrolase [Halothiobacillaceae bacterium]